MANARQDILGTDDIETRPVDVPEWPVDVYVRTFPGTVRSRLRAMVDGNADSATFSATAVKEAACTEDGSLIFTDDDIEALKSKSSVVQDRIIAAAMELNGMAEDAEDEAVKNS